MHEHTEPTHVTAAKNMRKTIIACLASAVLASTLHAEEQKAGNAFSSGLTAGAGKGAGGTQGTDPGNKMKSANRNSDQARSLLIKPTAKTKSPGSRKQQDRQ